MTTPFSLAHIITPTPPCLTMLYLVFAKHDTVYNDQTSPSWSHQKKLFQNVCGLFRCKFPTLIHTVILFLERGSFFSPTSIKAKIVLILLHLTNLCFFFHFMVICLLFEVI